MRAGIVLGAGGAVGVAYHSGVLAAIAEATGWDPRRAEIVVGTSAGSVVAAGLRAGLSGADLLARSQGRPAGRPSRASEPAAGPPSRSSGSAGETAQPPRASEPPAGPPSPSSGSAGETAQPLGPNLASLLGGIASRPFSTRPLAVLAALAPEGRASSDFIRQGISALLPDRWPDQDLWICAVRRRDGRRVVFGRQHMPEVAQAVAASCAIPGYYRPETIDGEAYIDGGVHSPTNADLLAGRGLDLVLVSSPMSRAGRRLPPAGSPPVASARAVVLDAVVRRWCRGLLDSEATLLRLRGAQVVAFQPTAADIEVMGPNAMDFRRRGAVARQAYESTMRRLEHPRTRERMEGLSG